MKYIAAMFIAGALAYAVIQVASITTSHEKVDRLEKDLHFALTTITNNALAINGSFDGVGRILNDHKQLLDQHQTNFAIIAHEFNRRKGTNQ